MKTNLLILLLILFSTSAFVFGETETIIQPKDYTVDIKTTEKQNYRVEIKQYKKDYPVILYIIFTTEIPPSNEIKNLLYKELKASSKKDGLTNNIIASAWIDGGTSDTLIKIELPEGSSAFVWTAKEKKIMSFADYLKFLKKQKKDNKNKDTTIQQ